MSVTYFGGSSTANSRHDNLDNFPGWERVGGFIKSAIVANNCKKVADIGGGAYPRIDLPFIRQHDVDYHLFDISRSELDKADRAYSKFQLDVGCDDHTFDTLGVPTGFDLIYSHMLLEHVEDPLQAHRNFFRMLRPGGISIHMFPSRNNFPLFANSYIPEGFSTRLLMKLQPHRSNDGHEGKFKAYYRHCGAPSGQLRNLYEGIGYEVVQHTGYVGHAYYKRIPPLAMVERQMRKLIIATGLPFISANLLILRKPFDSR